MASTARPSIPSRSCGRITSCRDATPSTCVPRRRSWRAVASCISLPMRLPFVNSAQSAARNPPTVAVPLSNLARGYITPFRMAQHRMPQPFYYAQRAYSVVFRLICHFSFTLKTLNPMVDNLNRRGPEDPTKVNVNESWEVTYWCQQFKCTEAQLRAAVRQVGVLVTNVRKYLSQR